jgi:hypothetical protein
VSRLSVYISRPVCLLKQQTLISSRCIETCFITFESFTMLSHSYSPSCSSKASLERRYCNKIEVVPKISSRGGTGPFTAKPRGVDAETQHLLIPTQHSPANTQDAYYVETRNDVGLVTQGKFGGKKGDSLTLVSSISLMVKPKHRLRRDQSKCVCPIQVECSSRIRQGMPKVREA